MRVASRPDGSRLGTPGIELSTKQRVPTRLFCCHFLFGAGQECLAADAVSEPYRGEKIDVAVAVKNQLAFPFRRLPWHAVDRKINTPIAKICDSQIRLVGMTDDLAPGRKFFGSNAEYEWDIRKSDGWVRLTHRRQASQQRNYQTRDVPQYLLHDGPPESWNPCPLTGTNIAAFRTCLNSPEITGR